MAKRPGGRSEPEIMAANVSRTTCLVFSTTSSGSLRVDASLMYLARVEVMSSAVAAERCRPADSGPTPAPTSPLPKSLNNSRREKSPGIFVVLYEVVTHDQSAFHHKLDALHLRNVG